MNRLIVKPRAAALQRKRFYTDLGIGFGLLLALCFSAWYAWFQLP